MERTWFIVILKSALWILNSPASAVPTNRRYRMALDQYVNTFDPHYSYTVLDNLTRREEEFTSYVLNMTSLKWLNESVVDRPVWWHYVTVTIPRQIRPGLENSAFFFIDGGANGVEPPVKTTPLQEVISAFAVSSGTVSACITQVPNQPLSFRDSVAGKKWRSGNDLLAYTWWHFLTNESDDPQWLLLFPMTKACVRGIDTVCDFMLKVSGGRQRIDRFTVSGASKRGWAAWLTAAVDSRVVTLMPIVMDLLNITQNLHHHFRAYGGWTFTFWSYYQLNITDLLDSPRMDLLTKHIDPLSYSERYRSKPKLLISAAGDEFFLLDDSHYYYQQLQGEKHLRILPNAEHTCAGHWLTLFQSIQAFYLSTTLRWKRPTMHWNRTQSGESGAIYLHTDTPPIRVLAYHADTWGAKRRDFRWAVAMPGHPDQFLFRPIPWWSSPVSSPSPGVYMKEFPLPKGGWRAFFIQATFAGPMGSVQTFSTEVHIIPETFPFPQCKAKGCHGTIV
ncbi:hypothetical protein AGOR_G00195930 [Albula goreensis]|uniref:Autocrine proliferation repressor protein A-like n=1 Tax=Albula goreensis TaxID=1534307 RepID=A0A8T3CV11_9TELE|nr:hypothetical protein AGOR_G00195930 [Albula goreensis]